MSPPAATAAKKAAPARPPVRRPEIRAIGTQDWASGAAFIKMFLVGDKDTGKTRYASAYPRPLYLATEQTVAASIATRVIEYKDGPSTPHVIQIEGTDDLLEVLAWLEKITSPPVRPADGSPTEYQTAVLDTADGLSRIIKDEWTRAENQGIFTGRDAWSYMEAKWAIIMQRLLSLDMNVLVLCHVKDYEVDVVLPDGRKDKETRYGAQLQGSTKDTILNDFDLVGRLDLTTINAAGERVRQRGITFESDDQWAFLTDHFCLTPPGHKQLGRKFWPITMHDGTKGDGSPQEFIAINYGQLHEAIVSERAAIPETRVVQQVPEVEGSLAGNGAAPANPQGGPVRGTVAAAPGAGAKPAAPPAKTTAAPPAQPAATSPAPPAAPSAAPGNAAAAPSDGEVAGEAGAAVHPGGGGESAPDATPESVIKESAEPSPAETQPAEPQAPAAAEATAPETPVAETSGAPAAEPAAGEPEPTHEQAVEQVADALGGEVIAHDSTPDTQKEGHCSICGKSLEQESPDLLGLSKIKHKVMVLPDGRKLGDTDGACHGCYVQLNGMKQKADAATQKAGTYFDPAALAS